jgi:REP element-mobilizing transposase RayT
MPVRVTAFSPGQYYHVYNRGSNRGVIFFEEENYRYLGRLVRKYVAGMNIAIIAYCLMPNHYHFLIRQNGTAHAGLLFQRVFNAYSKAINKRFDRTGTLFEGRFHSVHVDKSAYLLHLCRYIHANPVKAGLAVSPDGWEHSDYRQWVGLEKAGISDQEFIRANFGEGTEYAEFVAAYLSNELPLPIGIEKYLFEDT